MLCSWHPLCLPCSLAPSLGVPLEGGPAPPAASVLGELGERAPLEGALLLSPAAVSRRAVCLSSQLLFPSHPVPARLGSPRKIYQVSPQGRPNLPSRTGPFSFKPKYLFSCKTLLSS